MKPCLSRYLMVKQQIFVYSEIWDTPHYIPECEKDGYLWKPTQCDYPNAETCFCVDRETGTPIPETTRHDVIKEYMDCEGGEYATHIKSCEERVTRYKKIQEVVGIDHVFDYFPVCSSNGSFQAMQSNDRYFFCVDVTTGEKIPRTQSERELPITEDICTSFSLLWKRFKSSLSNGQHDEVVGPSSCRLGTIYEECGCKVQCNPGQNMMREYEECLECRPICRCPTGSFELNGQCVSNEECMATEPNFERKQQPQTWDQFMEENADGTLQLFFKLVQGEIPIRTDPNATPDQRTEDYSGDTILPLGEYENNFLYEEGEMFLPNRITEEITEYYEEFDTDYYEEVDFNSPFESIDVSEEPAMYVRIGDMQYKKSSKQT